MSVTALIFIGYLAISRLIYKKKVNQYSQSDSSQPLLNTR